jgi:phosphate transport system substrate-binding protein
LLGATLTTACTAPSDRRPGDSGAGTSAKASGARVDLTGAGATFPYPLYARWFNDYALRTNVRINYQSIGSGGGISQMLAGTVDFGATDVPMSDAEIAEARTPIVHIPTVLGAVAITYNLPERSRPLKLAGDVVADIFLGRVTRWNDRRIVALNPDAPLPDADILVVHRADGSGTSYIFSDYLSAVSPRWAAGPGRGKDVRWPTGIGGRGNEGVAGQVKAMVGAIGYVEVVYARQNRLPVAQLRNHAGRFVSPLPFEVAAAAAGATAGATAGALPPGSIAERAAHDLRRSLVNAPGDHAYPIASFTWMLLSPEGLGPEKTRLLAGFLRWALLDGGDMASQLGYVALPSETANRVIDRLDALAPDTTRRRSP